MRTTVNYKSHGKKKKGSSGKQNGGGEKGNSKSYNNGGDVFFKALAYPTAVKIYGILIMAFAIVAFLSILSFYFTFETDWQYANFGGENVADNWCGRFGAHIAVFFVNYLFGVFSIGFPFLLFLAGCKITFDKSPLPLWRTTYTTFLSMAWLSVALGCFVRNGTRLFRRNFRFRHRHCHHRRDRQNRHLLHPAGHPAHHPHPLLQPLHRQHPLRRRQTQRPLATQSTKNRKGSKRH